MMHTKYLILVIISASLVSALYSSSAVFGVEYTMSCSYTKDKKTSFCSDNDPTNNDVWRCDKQKNGTWKCDKLQTSINVPPDLKESLDIAIEETQNEPKVPKEPAFDNGLTTSPGTQNETEDPNGPAFNDGLTTSPGTR